MMPRQMSRMWMAWCRAVLPLGALVLSGCVAVTPVAPWQKGMLAKPEMGMEADTLERVLREHIYTSKEAASGGTAVGGGGCGCN